MSAVSSPALSAPRPPVSALGRITLRTLLGQSAAFLRRPLGACCALWTAVLVVYAPTLGAQFLWDDQALVRGNLLIRSPLFCAEIFRHTLFNGDSNFYRPTQTLVFLLDYWCGALDPFVYHLTSVAIHAANASLLYLLLRRVLSALWPAGDEGRWRRLALLVSLIWAVHPVHSAAVAYVSGSADSLAMLCCLSAALFCECALRATRVGPRVVFGGLAFAGLMFGLCSKEIAGIWLLLYLGYLFTLRPAIGRRAAGCVVVASLVAVAGYVGLRHLPTTPPLPPSLPSLPAKGLLMLRALGDYGGLMLFPLKLFMERQVFAAPGLANPEDDSVYFSLGVAGVLVLVAFVAGGLWRGRGRRLRLAGACWFMIGFLPVSNLFTLNASVAEHWLYLPSIGFLLFLAGAWLDAPPLLGPRAAWGALALVVGLLGTRTWWRTFDWTDELSFFRQTIADGGDVPRARCGLAVAYRRTHDDADAVRILRDVVAKYPKVLSPQINLANALVHQGNVAEARTLLEKAAATLYAQNDRDPQKIIITIKALDQLEADNPAWPPRRQALFDRARRQHPDSWELIEFSVGHPLDGQTPEQARTLVARFAADHWWHGPSRLVLGKLEARLGHPAAALAAWSEAARLDVYDVEADSAAAAFCLGQQRLREARDFQERAVRRQPDSPRQHLLLAQVLRQQGDGAGAARQLAEADQMVATAQD